jgi:hypothetical protein
VLNATCGSHSSAGFYHKFQWQGHLLMADKQHIMMCEADHGGGCVMVVRLPTHPHERAVRSL